MAKKKPVSLRLRAKRSLLRTLDPVVLNLAAPPKLEAVTRALFIQPHPDDNQIAAGGTIAMLVDCGVEVFELTVLDDRYTDTGFNGSGLTVRQREILSTQACLGMQNAGFLGFGDRTHATAREIADALVPVIRRIQPDMIFTADPNLETECHEDHLKVGNAVKTAFVDAAISFLPEYVDGKPRTDVWDAKALAFYYTDKPNTIVDISDYEEKKLESMKCHESQMSAGLLLSIQALAQQYAKDTPYKAAEPLRILSSMQTHCFNLPVGLPE